MDDNRRGPRLGSIIVKGRRNLIFVTGLQREVTTCTRPGKDTEVTVETGGGESEDN